MPIQSAGGAMAHFLRAGHGPEDAVLLHGMLAEARALDAMMAKLAGQVSMFAMDLPGHGLSEDWDTARDYGEMTASMATDLLVRPAHVIGHSYGGYAALRLAVDNPERVLSLTLIEPVFFAAASHSDAAAFKAYVRSAKRYMGALAVGDTVAAARGFTSEWGAGVPWEGLKPPQMDYITDRMKLVAASEASLVDDNGGVWDRLATLDMPVMLMEAQSSPKIMSSVLDGLESQIASAQRVKLAEGGHMVPLTHAEDCAQVIAQFITGQPRSTPNS